MSSIIIDRIAISHEAVVTAVHVDLSWAWCLYRASGAEVLMSEQMWWTQLVRGRRWTRSLPYPDLRERYLLLHWTIGLT